jgi:hypothetical protein
MVGFGSRFELCYDGLINFTRTAPVSYQTEVFYTMQGFMFMVNTGVTRIIWMKGKTLQFIT